MCRGTVDCAGCGNPISYCATCNVCTKCDYTANGGSDETVIPTVGKTTVTLVGTEESVGAYYEVEVPATMSPGDSANITIEGNWKSNEILKVTAPEKVTLYNGAQSIDVAIDFDGINAAGNDLADCSATATLKLAPASVKFGTWVGVIEYNVELVNGTTAGGNHGSGDEPVVNGGGSN